MNATPFPVVLLNNARGGVGDRDRPISASARARAAAIVPGPGGFAVGSS